MRVNALQRVGVLSRPALAHLTQLDGRHGPYRSCPHRLLVELLELIHTLIVDLGALQVFAEGAKQRLHGRGDGTEVPDCGCHVPRFHPSVRDLKSSDKNHRARGQSYDELICQGSPRAYPIRLVHGLPDIEKCVIEP